MNEYSLAKVQTYIITDATPKQIFMPKEKSANVAQ